MILKNKDNREIEIDSVSGSVDEPMIEDAYYLDSGEEITDADLDYLYDNYAGELVEQAFQNAVGQAEYAYGDD